MSRNLVPEDGSSRRLARRTGGLVGAFVMIAGLIIVLAVSSFAATWRLNSIQSSTDAVARGIERGVNQAVLKVESVDGFFQGSSSVTHVEFGRFAGNLHLQRDSDSILVALRVEAEQLESFMTEIAEWYPGVEPFEVLRGERVPLRQHLGSRFIVAYHQTPAARPLLVGYDFASEETRREAIRRALDSQRSVVSGMVHLVGTDVTDGFLVVSPVRNASGETVGVAAAATSLTSTLEVWVPESVRQDLVIRVVGGPAPTSILGSGRFTPVVSSEVHLPGATWTVVATMNRSGAGLTWFTVGSVALVVAFGLLTAHLISNRLERRSLRARLRWADLLASERDRTIAALSDFELLAENSSDVIARQDLELTYRYVSPSVEARLGYLPATLIGRQPWDWFHPEDKAQMRSSIDELVAGADSSEVEHRIRHADGRWLWFHTTLRAIRDESGKVGEIQTASREVSQAVAQREALREAQRETERAAAEKAKFLATVSHEIRTPLNAVAGMSELLSSTNLDDAQREYVETITTAASSVVSLVGDLLDMSRAEMGRLRIEAIPFDLASQVSEVMRLLAAQAQAKGLTLLQEIDAKLPPLLVGDPHRIRQVMVNLVGNALKFTEVGSVTVRVAVATDGSDETVRVRVEVVDTGIGIPSERLEAVFEEYEQVDDSVSRRFGGSGLGLGISRQLVTLMGGTLMVTSEPGRGSSFGFELDLPVARLAEKTPSACLIVGSSHARTVVAEALALEGWEAAESEWVDSAPMNLPLVVVGKVADVSAHDLTGAVVVDTAPRRGNAGRVETAGASAYLGSPFSSGELVNLIRLTTESSSFVTRHDLGEPSPSLRILAADDAPSNRLLVERMLSRRGHSVVSVADGAEALAAFASESFDVVLLDGEMPVMSGLDAMREIRALDEVSGRHTPIVVLTGRVSDVERGEAIAAGADMWVPKPFDSTRLYQVVEQAAGLTKVPVVESPLSVLDVDSFHVQVAGMPELARELADSVRNEWTELSSDLTPQQVSSHLQAAGSAAHRLRGVLSLVGATAAAEWAAALESAAGQGDAAQAKVAATRLEAMRQDVEVALDGAVVACRD